MPKILDLPKHLRPREKLVLKGAQNLSDKELLAILLRTGRLGKSAVELASLILNKFPTPLLLSTTLDELQSIKGVGRDKAISIIAAFELAKRAHSSFDNSLPLIDSPQ